MELEKQVVSLELAKRLKELGVEQGDWESPSPLFYWSYYDGGARRDKPELIHADECNFGFMEDLVAAFTVAELGEMLWEAGAEKFIKAYGEVFNFKGTSFVGDLGVMNLMRKPDMAAKMLIYLLENKLV